MHKLKIDKKALKQDIKFSESLKKLGLLGPKQRQRLGAMKRLLKR